MVGDLKLLKIFFLKGNTRSNPQQGANEALQSGQPAADLEPGQTETAARFSTLSRYGYRFRSGNKTRSRRIDFDVTRHGDAIDRRPA
jgi:hypothetical protein